MCLLVHRRINISTSYPQRKELGFSDALPGMMLRDDPVFVGACLPAKAGPLLISILNFLQGYWLIPLKIGPPGGSVTPTKERVVGSLKAQAPCRKWMYRNQSPRQSVFTSPKGMIPSGVTNCLALKSTPVTGILWFRLLMIKISRNR